MNKETFINACSAYIAQGFSVFPLKSHDKKPPAGFKWQEYQNRVATSEEVSQWADKYDDPNIAIVTGAISNIVVIDIDGEDGRISAEKLEIPVSPTVITGKGSHIYCRYPEGLVIGNSASKQSHIDIRGNGGYVVAPPSTHVSGNEYAWANDLSCTVEPLPEWVIKQFYPNYNTPSSAVQEETAQNVVVEGSRNDTIFRIACSLRNKGLSRNAILAAINIENLQICSPPLPDFEIERIVTSALNYENTKLYHLTDMGNAERLADRHMDSLRYIREMGKWVNYNGKFWETDDGSTVQRLAVETIRDIPLTAPHDMVEDYKDYARKCESRGKIESMTALSKNVMSISKDKFDSNQYILNIKNGVLDLNAGTFREHRSEDFITKMGEVEYDPKATCPTWDKFLNDIFAGNIDLVNYVQRCIGYSISGDTSEQVFFILHGEGANGKSTFMDTIKKILGDYGSNTDFETFIAKPNGSSVRNDIARLCGSRLVSASESGFGRVLDDSLLKQVTGGDRITARFLFQEHFEFLPTFKIWLTTNHRPRVVDDSIGIWRRVKFIPFEVVIPAEKRDRNLLTKLYAELPGILNWCLKGFSEWKRQGIGTCDAVDEATNDYRTDMDVFGRFLEECCDATMSGSRVATTDLYAAYRQWCEKNGEKEWTQTAFGIKLREKGFKKIKVHGNIQWCGVKLRAEY